MDSGVDGCDWEMSLVLAVTLKVVRNCSTQKWHSGAQDSPVQLRLSLVLYTASKIIVRLAITDLVHHPREKTAYTSLNAAFLYSRQRLTRCSMAPLKSARIW